MRNGIWVMMSNGSTGSNFCKHDDEQPGRYIQMSTVANSVYMIWHARAALFVNQYRRNVIGMQDVITHHYAYYTFQHLLLTITHHYALLCDDA